MKTGYFCRRIVVSLLPASFFFVSCAGKSTDTFQGYVEAEYVYVSAPVPGALIKLAVVRGANVAMGDALFELDSNPESTLVAEATARVKQAESVAADLQKGARAPELSSLTAHLEQAKIASSLSSTNFARAASLHDAGNIPNSELDEARRKAESDSALVTSLTADLDTASLGGREDRIQAAMADIEAATAALEKMKWTLAQKTQHAPVAGVVEDTLFRVGEFVPAGRPVVSFLPPANIKVRFFIPQARLTECKVGASVGVMVDGHPGPVHGTVSFVASQAEFTPPVIYNRENRQKLVFMVEATFAPDLAATLHPGQPVDVRLSQKP